MRRQFADQYADLERWHWWFRGRQRILETVLKRELSGRASLAFASVGCGPPSGLRWLAPFAVPSGRIVGVDADPLQAKVRDPSIDYVIGKFEAVPLQRSRFDVVLALDVLEHLDDDAAGVREGLRLLRPGGLLLATVPALPSLWGGQDIVSHHRRRYTRRSLAETFRCASAPRPRMAYFNFFLYPPIAALRLARRLAGKSIEARSDFEDTRPGVVNDLLASVFTMERYWIQRIPFPFGVSLLAIVHT